MLTRSTVISKLFQYLNEDRVNYVVVGDTRGYPEQVHGDTDIVTDACSLLLAQQSMQRLCTDHNIQIVQVLQHEQSAHYYVLAWFGQSGEVFTLNPDICTDYFRSGRLFLKAEEVLCERTRVLMNGGERTEIFIPSPARAFIYYLLKKIDKGDLDDRQGEYLSSQWKLDAQGAMSQIKRFWSGAEILGLTRAAEKNDWKVIRHDLGKYKAGLKHSLRFSIRNCWHESVRKLRRLVQPTGLLVVFLGSDGSGKSTIIEQVQTDLAPLFRRTKTYHLRPHFGRRVKDHAPVSDPHAQPPRKTIASCLKVLFYFADYSIGYCFAILPRKICSTLILFDRYFFDVIIDPKRLRYEGPQWMPVFLVKCIPSPDLIIYLDAPPDVLLSRKQEVSASELERQRRGYANLMHHLQRAHKVDASEPLPRVVANVERIIVEFMVLRVNKRLSSSLKV